MDENLENQNSTNTEPEKDTLNQTTNDDEEFLGENESELESLSQEALLALLQKERASKQKIYARMKKAEEKLKAQKPSEPKVSQEIKPEPKDPWKEKMEFAITHRDLDADQIDYISAFAKGKGISLEEALKDKLVAKVIKADKDEKRVASAIPRGKSLSPNYEDLHDKLSKTTSREEHKKLWKEMVERSKIKGVQAE